MLAIPDNLPAEYVASYRNVVRYGIGPAVAVEAELPQIKARREACETCEYRTDYLGSPLATQPCSLLPPSPGCCAAKAWREALTTGTPPDPDCPWHKLEVLT